MYVSNSKKTYGDIMNDKHKSSFDKKSSMRMHVDYMLKNNAEVECLVFDDGYIETVWQRRDVRMPKYFSNITYKHICSFVFVGKVVSYFASHAYKYTNEMNGLLEYKSATGYLSAFKNYFVMKFKGRDSIKPFDEKMWTKYRGKLRQMKVAQAKAAQKLLSTPKKMASDNDRLTIFGCCTWENTKDGALLIALMSILFQVGGCVSKGSTVSKTNLKAEVSYYCEINTIIILF